jgi:hypothetical protein
VDRADPARSVPVPRRPVEAQQRQYPVAAQRLVTDLLLGRSAIT